MKTISEAIKEFKFNESGNFHISIEKPSSGSIREFIDEIDAFLATKGVRTSELDIETGKLIFKKHEEVMKAKKVLDRSSYKNKYKTVIQ